METRAFRQSTDQELRAELPRLASRERDCTADLVACLGEFDRRRLYLELGFSSIYAYCAVRLHLTEGGAYRRIEAARASLRFPVVLDMLRDGRLSLATAALIGPKLTTANADGWLAESAFKSKREVEVLLARRQPQPPVPTVIRKLPAQKIAGTSSVSTGSPVVPTETAAAARAAAPAVMAASVPTVAPASRRPLVAPLSDIHYKLQVTIGAAARERLTQIQALMRHRLPSGDPAAIVEHALEVLHAELLKQKAAQVSTPRGGRSSREAAGRHVPASVKREVWRRDEGRCAFVAPDGRRCGSYDGVEFHHVQPYAVGGQATPTNIEMRCRAHNAFEWQQHLENETMNLVGQVRAERQSDGRTG